jgi:FixJ family two-component response regulator
MSSVFRYSERVVGRPPGIVRTLVYILDADLTDLRLMAQAIESHGMQPILFKSGQDYLAHPRTDALACLILDPLLPDADALDLLAQHSTGVGPPIVLVSSHEDMRYTVRAVKAGAIEFLRKPVDPDVLCAAVDLAIAEDVRARERNARKADLWRRYQLLTPREKQVLPLIVSGLRNKQAASVLGVAEVTVQVHRGQIMRKMAARSFADLIRMAGGIGIPLYVGPTPRAGVESIQSATNPYAHHNSNAHAQR